MFATELDSFVQKFHQLWRAGVTANLDLDTHAGNAWVGLRVQLGHVPGPAHQFPGHHRGPAYQRRQVRRQAARAAAETSSSSTDLRSSDALPAAEANNACDTEEVDLTEKSPENEAEQANFPCNICDFESNWANGLNVHMTRKHHIIEQLDGCDSFSDELDEDDKYMKTLHYWKKGFLGTVYQTYLDVVDVIKKSDLTEESKDDERAKALEARKHAFGKDFEHFPPWNSN